MLSSRTRIFARFLAALVLILGALPTQRASAQDQLVTALGLDGRKEYDEMVANARIARDAGDYSEALSRYDSAYKKGLEVAREGGFGSRRMVIPLDIQTGKTLDMMVPRGKEVLSPLIEEAARVAVLADKPETVLYWLRIEGIYAYPPTREIEFPDTLDVSNRLRGDRLTLLRELTSFAEEQGIERTASALRLERARHKEIADFEYAFWQQKKQDARWNAFVILILGLLVIAGVILWFSWPSMLLPRVRWINKPHKMYRRYAPKATFRWPFLERYKRAPTQITEVLSWFLLLVFLSGLGFVMAGFFMHQLWERPLRDPFICVGLTWLFGGLGLFMLALLFFDRNGTPSIDPLGKFIVVSRAENFLATYERMQQERIAICQHHKIPGLFTRWRSMEQATINLLGQLSGRGTVPRVLVGLFVADHLRRAHHEVPPQVELWIRDGLNNGLLVYFEEAMDDYLDLLPMPDRLRWFREFPILQHRLTPELESGTPDLEKLEDELEIALENGRRWSVQKWRERFVQQELYSSLRHSVIWGAYDRDGHLLQTFRVEDEMTLVDAEMEEVDLERVAPFEVGIAHPGDWSEQARMNWAEHMADFELIMACSQLDRERITIDRAGAEDDPEVLRLGFEVSEAKIKQLWKEGWQQPYSSTYFERTFPFYGCKVRVEPDEGSVRFFDAIDVQTSLEVANIHPVALSEIIYTLRSINALD